MILLIKPSVRVLPLRSKLGETARFAGLACGLFVALIAMALIEGAVLWLAGVRYTPKSSLHRIGVGDFSVSADGRWGVSRIVITRRSTKFAAQYDVVLHDLKAHRAVRLHLESLEPQCVAISPRGDYLAVACLDGSIYAGPLSPSDGQEPPGRRVRLAPLATRLDSSIEKLFFSPDGRHLAAVGWRWVLRFPCTPNAPSQGGASDERITRTFSKDYVAPHWLSWGYAGRVLIWHSAQGDRVSAAHPQAVYAACGYPMALSPDGALLAAARWRSGKCLIEVCNATNGQTLQQLPGHAAAVAGVLFASEHRIFSWDVKGNLYSWDLRRPHNSWQFSLGQWAAGDPSFRQAPAAQPRSPASIVSKAQIQQYAMARR